MIVNSIYGQTFSLSADVFEIPASFSLFSHNYSGFSFFDYNYRKLLVLKYLFHSAEISKHCINMQKLCNEDKIQTDCDIFRT